MFLPRVFPEEYVFLHNVETILRFTMAVVENTQFRTVA